MPTPPNGRPTDELLIEAARAHVLRLFGPGKAPRAVSVTVEGVLDPITLPVPSPCYHAATPDQPAAAAEPFAPTDDPEAPFVLSEAQGFILEALDGKALKTGPLCKAPGLSHADVFRDPGGIQELQRHGLVSRHPRAGYFRPEAPPEGFGGKGV
jgi:hypothetical protein